MLASLLPETNVGSWQMLKAIWEPHLWVFAASLLLTLILTPVCRAVAMRWRVYDMPDERLKTHDRPIPYLGGVAIFLGWAIPVLLIAVVLCANPQLNTIPAATLRVIEETRDPAGAVPPAPEAPGDGTVAPAAPGPLDEDRAEVLEAQRPWPPPWIEQPGTLLWIVGAALLMMLLGLIDDLKELPPRIKVGGQIVAALMLAAGGMIFMAFPEALPADLGGYALFPPQAAWVLVLGILFQIVLVVGAANAANLLDGLDGLCSGVTAFISAGFLVLATSLLAWHLFRGGQAIHYVHTGTIVLLAFALLGSVLGFLPYNFNPASIFMGDAGSMFLGFMAAVFMVLFAERSEAFKWFLGSMVIFGLPIFDTGLALVRRLVGRRPVFAGDRSHFYDQLVDRGFSVQKSVVINYALALLFVLAGVGIVFLRTRYGLPIYLAIFAIMTAAALKLGFLRVDGRPPMRRRGPPAEKS
jgi:UDP-GlcNAc:undecaprenyl-phosphate GlcNAc-1-phosphate transferase